MFNNTLVINPPQPGMYNERFVPLQQIPSHATLSTILLEEPTFRLDSITTATTHIGTFMTVDDNLSGVAWEMIENRDGILVGELDDSQYVIDKYGFPLSQPCDTIEPSQTDYVYYDVSETVGERVKKHIGLVPTINFQQKADYELLYYVSNIPVLQYNPPMWTIRPNTDNVQLFDGLIKGSCIIQSWTYYHDDTVIYDLLQQKEKQYERKVYFTYNTQLNTVNEIDEHKNVIEENTETAVRNIPISVRKRLQRLF